MCHMKIYLSKLDGVSTIHKYQDIWARINNKIKNAEREKTGAVLICPCRRSRPAIADARCRRRSPPLPPLLIQPAVSAPPRHSRPAGAAPARHVSLPDPRCPSPDPIRWVRVVAAAACPGVTCLARPSAGDFRCGDLPHLSVLVALLGPAPPARRRAFCAPRAAEQSSLQSTPRGDGSCGGPCGPVVLVSTTTVHFSSPPRTKTVQLKCSELPIFLLAEC